MFGKSKTIKCRKFNINHFSVGEIDFKNERMKGQGMAYVNYGKGQCVLQTREITMMERGIPRFNKEFAETDAKRSFVKIPFLPDQNSCMELRACLEALDAYCIKHQKKIFGKRSDKYEYSKLVKPLRVAEVDDDDSEDEDDNGKEKTVWESTDFCKAKLDTDFNSGELKTVFYVNTPLDNDSEKTIRVKTKFKDINDLCTVFNWKCKAKFIIKVTRLWAAKSKFGGANKKFFGLSLKIIQIAVTPGEGSKKMDNEDFGFEDSSDDESDEDTNAVNKKTVVVEDDEPGAEDEVADEVEDEVADEVEEIADEEEDDVEDEVDPDEEGDEPEGDDPEEEVEIEAVPEPEPEKPKKKKKKKKKTKKSKN